MGRAKPILCLSTTILQFWMKNNCQGFAVDFADIFRGSLHASNNTAIHADGWEGLNSQNLLA